MRRAKTRPEFGVDDIRHDAHTAIDRGDDSRERFGTHDDSVGEPDQSLHALEADRIIALVDQPLDGRGAQEIVIDLGHETNVALLGRGDERFHLRWLDRVALHEDRIEFMVDGVGDEGIDVELDDPSVSVAKRLARTSDNPDVRGSGVLPIHAVRHIGDARDASPCNH
ncbi:hypothetical protein [Agromyces humatus]|uniref:hypothetical protein n=1 Tax=Agromyces humatus TaxID=279573 RepID=UPI001E2956DF|nr:hypothetical protein [Agromyces humatus]